MTFLIVLILAVIGIIFFGTIFMKPSKKMSNEIWTKVRFSTNGTHRDGWCRVVAGKGVTYYGIDGNPVVNEKVNVIRTYEICEQPPFINEEDTFVHVLDSKFVSCIDNRLRRAS